MSGWLSMAIVCATLSAPPQFENVTEEWGIEPFHLLGPSTIAIGAAFFDWDNDGYLDVYLAGGSSPNLLMRNMGPPHFGYEDVSVESGIEGGARASGRGRRRTGGTQRNAAFVI